MTTPSPVSAAGNSRLRKIETIVLLALMTSLTGLSIDIMLAAMPDIGAAFSGSKAADIHLIVPILIVGMVFGELVFGPLSDAIGRKNALFIGIAIYCAGTIVVLVAPSLEIVLLGRLIQGIGVSGPKIATRAMIRDLYVGDAMARIMSFILLMFILVPMLAPALGQMITHLTSWRGTFAFLLIFSVAITIWFAIRRAETLAPEKRIPIAPRTLFHNAVAIITDFQVMAYAISGGLVFGALLTYASLAQSVFQDIYNTGTLFPLYFAIMSLSLGLASILNSQLVMRIGAYRMTAIAALLLISVSTITFIVILLTNGTLPLPIFMGLYFICFFCFGVMFGNLGALAMVHLGHIAGIGSSVIASVSSLVGALVSMIGVAFYDQTLIPLTAVINVTGLLSFLLIMAAGRVATRQSQAV
ncbi:MAG: multidrug effflux MFS transporter [Cohaesibacteraceae bacterium]|nr:multidrug effflux MFS transporter [Cohaesibacteraceae bacterium]